MYRIIMSIAFVVIIVGAYFLSNGTTNEPEVQQMPPSGSTFNNL